MRHVYNENDSFAARWLRNLAAAGHIPEGKVDDRSIEELKPEDCGETFHAFAGIGGWPYALHLARWPEHAPVWTGSCPCQPWSVAGRGEGPDDPRHLWPAWFRLIRQCKPPAIFGEQSAGPDAVHWLAAVQADLESIGYAVGRADLAAAGVGAPTIRQRLYWVAYANGWKCDWRPSREGSEQYGEETGRKQDHGESKSSRQERNLRRMANADGRDAGTEGLQRSRKHGQQPEDGRACGLGVTERPGLERHPGNRTDENAERPNSSGPTTAPSLSGFWGDAGWLECTDGLWRPAKSSIFPLAPGLPGRVGLIRGAGNSIVPQLAAEFISAAMESTQ